MISRGDIETENRCRVCGWDFEELTRPDGFPSYLICSCCGAEVGVDDIDLKTIRKYRQKWIDRGAPWFSMKERPVKWSIQLQLESVPFEYA